jgi:hypothetical protein
MEVFLLMEEIAACLNTPAQHLPGETVKTMKTSVTIIGFCDGNQNCYFLNNKENANHLDPSTFRTNKIQPPDFPTKPRINAARVYQFHSQNPAKAPPASSTASCCEKRNFSLALSLPSKKQTTPFSITLSTPTCDLINIYTFCLPQGCGVRDVVILLIGATPTAPLLSAQRRDHPQANINT